MDPSLIDWARVRHSAFVNSLITSLPFPIFGTTKNAVAVRTGAQFGVTAERTALIERLVTADGALNTSQTVAQQLATQRSFIPTQSILDTVGSGVRFADPQGVAGQFMYRAEAWYNNTRGTLEVLVDEVGGQINHVLFRSGP